ncbi:hypothetical protein BT93_L0465 [Corymbia citriodora subsp. variegata]|uniref:Uncharacterized protein n=1 Tax=Corymbia citriodora subsp. variegata TaxID=360336 RepID=A0A8T0CPS9_CORYI|nr:hypothetical protein BT93_L0465 [Corymbia citriodora subsp. variegata]
MVRHPLRLNKNNNAAVKKGTWSAEEDQKLIAYIRRYGFWNWTHVPKPAGKKYSCTDLRISTGKSCRLRWMNYLRPNMRHGSITKEEEDMIIKLHRLLGNKWVAIAAKLPRRTENEIKNYWDICLKKCIKNGKKLQISIACDIKVKPSLPTIDTPKLKPDIVSQIEIPTMSGNSFCTSYGIHYDDQISENGWYSPCHVIGKEESLGEQFLALKDFQIMKYVGGTYMQSGASVPGLVCMQQELEYHSGSYEDFMVDSWES